MPLQDALGAPNDQDTAFHNEKLSRVRLEPTFRRLPVAAPSVSDALRKRVPCWNASLFSSVSFFLPKIQYTYSFQQIVDQLCRRNRSENKKACVRLIYGAKTPDPCQLRTWGASKTFLRQLLLHHPLCNYKLRPASERFIVSYKSGIHPSIS